MKPTFWTSPRAAWLAGGVIVFAGLLAYLNSFGGPFIFDDEDSIPENTTIRHLWPLGPVLAGPRDAGLTVSGRPLVNLSFAVNYAISGKSVWSYHATNVAIHLLAGLTLFGILRRTLLRPALAEKFGRDASALALAIALLWTVHPLQTEAVTYMVQRAESLMGLLYLLTLYGFICAVEAKTTGGEGGRTAGVAWYVLSIAACWLGMATKEVMVSAPLLVWLYDRTLVAGTFREAWQRRLPYYMGLFPSWLLLLAVVARNGGNRGLSIGFGNGVDWWSHALTQFPAIVRYLCLSVWPRPQILDYENFTVPSFTAVAPQALIVLLLAIATVVAFYRRSPAVLLGILFFAPLAPTSILPSINQLIVEHRMYLPLAAVLSALVLGLYAWLGRASLGVCLAAALALGWLTVRRNADYRSAADIWADTVAKAPGNPLAHSNLGKSLMLLDRTPEAIAQFEQALKLKPDYAIAHNNLGVALARSGRTAEAIAQYEAALQLQPDDGQTHHNLGNLLLQTGRVSEAMANFSQAQRAKPELAAVQENNLGSALLQLGRTAEAVRHLESALRLQPAFPEAENNLGNALAQSGRNRDAVPHYEAALRLESGNALTHYNLGNALQRLGRVAESVPCYESALQLKPGFPEAHNNLGSALEQLGRLAEARVQYAEALRLDPAFAEARNNVQRTQATAP